MGQRTTSQPHVKGWGVDAPAEKRPGVPMETPPHPAAGTHWSEPERQRPTIRPVERREAPTPVFGTAQPARGLSGALRRAAYGIPEHRPSHWLLLLFADRVDVVESAMAETARRRPGLATAAALVGIAVLASALRR